MNIRQWEETPLTSASKAACLESVRRRYVEKLTREFIEDMQVEEIVSDPVYDCFLPS